MTNIIDELIKRYNKIIVTRHIHPDYDAYGSQIGLYLSIKETYPEKEVYLDGDENENNLFGIKSHTITKELLKDSLYIITDTACKNMLPNNNIKYAKDVIIIDHHENEPDINGTYLIKTDYSSASEVVAEFLIQSNYKISKLSSSYIFAGIVGDTNRFLYKGTSKNTFKITSFLIDKGIDIVKIYKLMQKEEMEGDKRIKGYVLSNFIIDKKVAYVYVSNNTIKVLNTTTLAASRGCIDLLANIKGVDVHVIFCETENNEIYVEMRSKEKSIVDIAKKHGGGGHALACGTTLMIGYKYKDIIDDLNEVLK